LITGVNSSGKSSFIQSLLFFRENRENILAINQFKGRSYPASFNGKYIKLGEEALLFVFCIKLLISLKRMSFAHFPLVPLVIDIKKSELSSNNIAFNSSIKKSLFSKNKSLSSISSKQTVKTSNNDKLTILLPFKTLDEDEFKTMNNFLDLAMEKIDTKSQDELDTLQDNLIKVLKFSNQVLGEKHKFSRSIASEKRSKMVNLSLFDVLTVCFDEIDDKDLFLENKDFFIEELKAMLLDESSDFFLH
jgi:hypothetical protein